MGEAKRRKEKDPNFGKSVYVPNTMYGVVSDFAMYKYSSVFICDNCDRNYTVHFFVEPVVNDPSRMEATCVCGQEYILFSPNDAGTYYPSALKLESLNDEHESLFK